MYRSLTLGMPFSGTWQGSVWILGKDAFLRTANKQLLCAKAIFFTSRNSLITCVCCVAHRCLHWSLWCCTFSSQCPGQPGVHQHHHATADRQLPAPGAAQWIHPALWDGVLPCWQKFLWVVWSFVSSYCCLGPSHFVLHVSVSPSFCLPVCLQARLYVPVVCLCLPLSVYLLSTVFFACVHTLSAQLNYTIVWRISVWIHCTSAN